MVNRGILWGRWWPLADETDGLKNAPLEWWPSRVAVQHSLMERLAPTVLTTSRCRVNRADGTTVTDAQYYGSKESRIYLYEVDGTPGPDVRLAADQQPYAVVEFGPRGGIRRRALTPAGSTR